SGPSKVASRRRKDRSDEGTAEILLPPAKRPKKQGESSGNGGRAKAPAVGTSGKKAGRKRTAAPIAPARVVSAMVGDSETTAADELASSLPPVRKATALSAAAPRPTQADAENQTAIGELSRRPRPESELGTSSGVGSTSEGRGDRSGPRLKPALVRPASEPEDVEDEIRAPELTRSEAPPVPPGGVVADPSVQPKPLKRPRPNPRPVPADSPDNRGADLFDLSNRTARRPSPPSVANTSRSVHLPAPSPSTARPHGNGSCVPAFTSQDQPEPMDNGSIYFDSDYDPNGQRGEQVQQQASIPPRPARYSTPATGVQAGEKPVAAEHSQTGRREGLEHRVLFRSRRKSKPKDGVPPGRAAVIDSDGDEDYCPTGESSTVGEHEQPAPHGRFSPIRLHRRHPASRSLPKKPLTVPMQSRQLPAVRSLGPRDVPMLPAGMSGNGTDRQPVSVRPPQPLQPLQPPQPSQVAPRSSAASESLGIHTPAEPLAVEPPVARPKAASKTSAHASSSRSGNGGPSVSLNPKAKAPGPIQRWPDSFAKPFKRNLAPPPTLTALTSQAAAKRPTAPQDDRRAQLNSSTTRLRSQSPDAPVLKLNWTSKR
ncbi:hypothetical protein FRC06_008558, partial [Ceratobasidium sp. 370]